MSNEQIKTYTATLVHTTEQKKKYISKTFDYLENGCEVFLWTFLSILGGVSKNALQKNLPKNKNNEESYKLDLLCAIFWFRVVPINTYPTHPILAPTLPSLFEKYFGSKPSQEVLEYFSSNYDKEKYVWQDMKEEFHLLAKRINVSVKSFEKDIELMLNEEYFGIKCGKALSAISGLFGTGEKVDRKPKTKILIEVIKELEKSSPQTVGELAKTILKCSNCKDSKELYQLYSSNKGSPPILVIRSEEVDSQLPLHPEDIEVLIGKLKDDLKRQSSNLIWNCNGQLKKYLISKIGNFNQCAWSEMLNNSLTSVIQSKTTRNYNFVLEQIDNKLNLDENHAKFAEIINNYFNSDYFNGDDKFLICGHHVGGKDLKSLWKSWNGLNEEELGQEISQFCSDVNLNNKMPIYSLLKYLHSIQDKINWEEVLQGTSYNNKKDKLESQKLHPIVSGHWCFNWGVGSKITGRMISPEKKNKHFYRPNDTTVWFELSVLNDDSWEKHHYMINNTRFYEEVYCVGENDFCESKLFRTKRFGCENNTPLTEEEVLEIKNADKSHKKSIKRKMRAIAASRSGQLPKVTWNDNFNINISRWGKDNYHVIISNKFKVEKFNNPAVFSGFDQNQTAQHTTYSFQESNISDGCAIPYKNHWLKPLENDYVKSIQYVGNTPVDQLSYSGVEWDCFTQWRKEREDFVFLWRYVNSKNNKGKEIQIDMFELLKRKEAYKPSLYAYNAAYLKSFKQILKKKTPTQLKEIRNEILAVIRDGKFAVLRLASLNHNSFDMFRHAKGVINAYFNNLLGSGCNDKQKQEADKEMFDLRVELEVKRKNKAKSKENLIANSLTTKSLMLRNKIGPVLMGGEAISNIRNKNNKKQANAKSMDWLERAVAHKTKQTMDMHKDLCFMEINPYNSSHYVPLVHNNPDVCMRSRFGMCDPDRLSEKDFKSLVCFSKKDDSSLYSIWTHKFMNHYQLTDNEMKLSYNKFKDLMKEILKTKNEEVMIYPRRGGRAFLSTYKLQSDAQPYVFDGEKYWICNADIIAACNIALSVFDKWNARKKAATARKS